MHYGIEVVTLGDYADPRPVAKLAQAAEFANWEAIFVWDHLGFVWGAPSGDPWVILSAVAQATKRLKLGTAIAPLARYRPQMIANTVATLDLLSEGRMIFGAGLGGVAEEFSAFGDPGDAKQRAARLDEALDVINRLWGGEKVTHHGAHYSINEVALAPLPVQQPRVPIWIGGESKPALRRAAKWDGWVIGGANEKGEMTRTPEQLAGQIAYIREHRASTAPFNVALDGYSSAKDPSVPRSFEAVGATWWLESLHGFRGSFDELLARVKAGPPI